MHELRDRVRMSPNGWHVQGATEEDKQRIWHWYLDALPESELEYLEFCAMRRTLELLKTL